MWKYVNPVTKDGILTQGDTLIDNNHIFRCYRYDIDYPGFVGKDLAPGNPIELYTDTDGDGIIDNFDNCPDSSNAGQEDSDGDGIGDVCDPDPLAVEDSEVIPENLETLNDIAAFVEQKRN